MWSCNVFLTSYDADDEEDDDAADKEFFSARLTLAQKKLNERDFKGAEAQFEACLAEVAVIKILPRHEVYDLKLELATACRGLGNTAKQQDLLLELLNVESSDVQTLHVKHALAIAYLDDHMREAIDLTNSQLDAARKYADEARKGRRRLLGSRHQSYHETIYLLVAICKAQKDHNSAEVYQGLLPPGFQTNTEWSLIAMLPHNTHAVTSGVTPGAEAQVLPEAGFDTINSFEEGPDFQHAAKIRVLSKAGFDINNELERQPALKWACTKGDLPIVRWLINASADVKFRG